MTEYLVISLPKTPYTHRIYNSGQLYASAYSGVESLTALDATRLL
jgi:hypothetical protein